MLEVPSAAPLDRFPAPSSAQGLVLRRGGLYRPELPLLRLLTGFSRTIVANGAAEWLVNANGLLVQRVVRARAW